MINTPYIPDINPYKYNDDIQDHQPSTYDEADAYECNNLIFHTFEAAYHYAIGFAFGSSNTPQQEDM